MLLISNKIFSKRKAISLLLLASFLFVFSDSMVFAAGNGNGYVKCSGSHGGTSYVYSDSVGGTKLAKTSLIQFIYAGANGLINSPDANGNPTVDDSLITPPSTGTVGTPWNTDGEFFYFLDNMTDKAKIYVRVWNAATVGMATKYGDSAVYTVNGDGNQNPKPTPFTWNVTDGVNAGGLATTINKLVANSAPLVPTDLAQNIATYTNTNFNITMSMSDLNNPDTLTPQVEVTTDIFFTDDPNFTGARVPYAGNPVVGTVPINVAGLADGIYKWQARVRDAGGLTSDFEQYNGGANSFIVDKTGPTAVIITAPASPTNNINLNFSWTAATDAGSGLNATPYYYLIDSFPTAAANAVKAANNGTADFANVLVTGNVGNNYLHVVAVDKLGNLSTVAHSSLVVVDTTPPTMTFSPATGAQNVGLLDNIVITFSEPVNNGSFSYSITPSLNVRSEIWNLNFTAVTLTHDPFVNSTQYTVKVITIDDLAGNRFVRSNSSVFTILPAAPVAAAASNLTATAFSANWNISSGATGYRLDVATDNAFNNILVNYTNKDIGNNATSAPVSGLTAGTPYYYRVRAYNNGGTSGNSNIINTTTLAALVAISNLAIKRDADTPNASVTVNWTTNPANSKVDVYALDGTFTTVVSKWGQPVEKDNQTGSFINASQVGKGTARYYKVVPAGKGLANSDLTADVVGKFDLALQEGYTLVSSPLILSDTSLDAAIGKQLASGAVEVFADKILKYNGAGYDIAWLKSADSKWYSGANSTTVQFTPDAGYWINIYAGHGAKNITLVGKVTTAVARGPIRITGSGTYSLIGSTYPTAVDLNNSGLAGSGATGGLAEVFSAKVLNYNGAGYDIAWLKSSDSKWYSGSNPTTIQFQPGKGYWVYEPQQPNGYNWNYPKPY